MALHRWTGYVGYEKQCARNYFQLVVDFCYQCHGPLTDDEGCETCPTGMQKRVMYEYLCEFCKHEGYRAERKYVETFGRFLKAAEAYEKEMRLPTSDKEREEAEAPGWLFRPNPVLEEAFGELERTIGPFSKKLIWEG